MWQHLGYPANIRLNMEIVAGYGDATGTVTLRSFKVDVDGVGKLALDAKLSGVPLTNLTNEEEAKKLLATGKLESFHLRFDNSGVVEKLLKMLAEQNGAK